MHQLLSLFGTFGVVLLVLVGFSLIIVVHELGHFLAARWAGIRVLAFAVGFGPALVSYRKGIGFRRGSSVGEYTELAGGPPEGSDAPPPGVSRTEYRLNVLPFGGYVKMLGQDDADPSARSIARDGYGAAPPWKRMIVISAGVVMNLILAAVLFVVVFLAGLRTEPPVIGALLEDSPARKAVAVNAAAAGVPDSEAGLMPGDRILEIDGGTPNTFNDLVVASAMARRGRPVSLVVARDGVPTPLRFEITPEEDPLTKLLHIGIMPRSSTQLPSAPSESIAADFRRSMDRVGLPGLEPGMRLTSVGGQPASSADEIPGAVRASGGQPVPLTFVNDGDGRAVTVELRPRPRLQQQVFVRPDGTRLSLEHLAGLMPVMGVQFALEDAEKAGLRDGDVFVRIGGVEWPNLAAGIPEIRRHSGSTIAMTVLRRSGETGAWERIAFDAVPVSGRGTVGFIPSDDGSADARVSAWPELAEDGATSAHAAARPLRLLPGTRITAVDGVEVRSFGEVRRELRRAAEARPEGAGNLDVTLTVELPVGGGARETRAWSIPGEVADQIAGLGWNSPLSVMFFEREQFLLRAESPSAAVGMGLHETRRIMLTTYVTFARLFEGSVKVEHLKGPVGIAHLGTIVASKGFIWLLFFLALISVNLAVINFLPIPIADGGHFLMILYEQIVGKPVPVGFQNIATLAGLALIVGLFLIVTFNDISNLISGG